ncbi:hypothetical protein [Spongiactinospora sp. TRM90649]|uniref:hypothetical protein n=1 Tax=Spongiactinospora sp. TRM90649 TaxID=3031114 RepID=UPI0023F8D868|nr:hypothetical protein [Spongiactinospora sp. TRM90649]MDF5753360.1 hypothetical protein [Spongiactinospora sp. TRM90649]
MSFRRQLATVAGSAVLCLGAAALAPSSAMAAPTGCTTWITSGVAYSLCTGGTGLHGVAVEQSHPLAGPILMTGDWRPAGEISSVRLTPWPVKRIWVNKVG